MLPMQVSMLLLQHSSVLVNQPALQPLQPPNRLLLLPKSSPVSSLLMTMTAESVAAYFVFTDAVTDVAIAKSWNLTLKATGLQKYGNAFCPSAPAGSCWSYHPGSCGRGAHGKLCRYITYVSPAHGPCPTCCCTVVHEPGPYARSEEASTGQTLFDHAPGHCLRSLYQGKCMEPRHRGTHLTRAEAWMRGLITLSTP